MGLGVGQINVQINIKKAKKRGIYHFSGFQMARNKFYLVTL